MKKCSIHQLEQFGALTVILIPKPFLFSPCLSCLSFPRNPLPKDSRQGNTTEAAFNRNNETDNAGGGRRRWVLLLFEKLMHDKRSPRSVCRPRSLWTMKLPGPHVANPQPWPGEGTMRMHQGPKWTGHARCTPGQRVGAGQGHRHPGSPPPPRAQAWEAPSPGDQ